MIWVKLQQAAVQDYGVAWSRGAGVLGLQQAEVQEPRLDLVGDLLQACCWH